MKAPNIPEDHTYLVIWIIYLSGMAAIWIIRMLGWI